MTNIDFGFANKKIETEKKIIPLPEEFIENPFFGKQRLTPFEAIDAINCLSIGLMNIERRKKVHV